MDQHLLAGLGLEERGLGGVELGLGRVAGLVELLEAFVAQSGVDEACFGAAERCLLPRESRLGRVEGRDEILGIKPDNHIVLLDLLALFEWQRKDLGGYLRRDVDQSLGFDGAGRGDGALEIAKGDGLHDHRDAVLVLIPAIDELLPDR